MNEPTQHQRRVLRQTTMAAMAVERAQRAVDRKTWLLGKALVDAHDAGWTIRELERATGMSRTNVWRRMRLEREGF